ncbi:MULTISPECIES: hypothetical protein [Pseudomonas]|uniref:Uncharacterized protein n=1 Tax=Pseudomonas fluorescens TaxID=294 RepID=A0A166QN85_PSEFL|nr:MULTISPECIES: hypothetical protein [Pseudomonas]KZN20574.1 hypothetical protein A1D17_03280 [Pseudomonas fluorescens]
MNIFKVSLVSAMLVSGAAGAAVLPDSSTELSKLATKTLAVDGITDTRIVEIVDSKKAFIFTYCRVGSESLWRHEVISNDAPDSPTATKVAYDQAVESSSASCKVAG